MIERARNLRFVNNFAMWPLISGDFAALADPSAAAKPLREETALLVRSAEDQLHDFQLGSGSVDYLDQWVAGNFDPGAAPDRSRRDDDARGARRSRRSGILSRASRPASS